MSAGDGRVEAHYIPTAINCMVDMRGELPESLPRPRGCFHRARWSYGGPPADSAAAGQRCVGLCEPSVDPRRHPSPLPPPYCHLHPTLWRRPSHMESSNTNPPEQRREHSTTIPAEQRREDSTTISAEQRREDSSTIPAEQRHDVLLNEAVAAARRAEERVTHLQLQWQLAAVSLYGLHDLQDVIPFQHFALDRALAACVLSRLLKRLRLCLAHAAAVTRETSVKALRAYRGLVAFEVDCTRLTMEQPVQDRQLVCVTSSHSRSATTTRTVTVHSFEHLFRALSMSPTVVAMAKQRAFQRKDGQLVTRVLVQEFKNVDGRVFFVLLRDGEQEKVVVAVVETEEWDYRGKRFFSPLLEKGVAYHVLPGRSQDFPASLSQHEAHWQQHGGN